MVSIAGCGDVDLAGAVNRDGNTVAFGNDRTEVVRRFVIAVDRGDHGIRNGYRRALCRFLQIDTAIAFHRRRIGVGGVGILYTNLGRQEGNDRIAGFACIKRCTVKSNRYRAGIAAANGDGLCVHALRCYGAVCQRKRDRIVAGVYAASFGSGIDNIQFIHRDRNRFIGRILNFKDFQSTAGYGEAIAVDRNRGVDHQNFICCDVCRQGNDIGIISKCFFQLVECRNKSFHGGCFVRIGSFINLINRIAFGVMYGNRVGSERLTEGCTKCVSNTAVCQRIGCYLGSTGCRAGLIGIAIGNRAIVGVDECIGIRAAGHGHHTEYIFNRTVVDRSHCAELHTVGNRCRSLKNHIAHHATLADHAKQALFDGINGNGCHGGRCQGRINGQAFNGVAVAVKYTGKGGVGSADA